MGGVGVELLADFLQRGHPGDSQMAVLEHHPGAFFLAGLDHLEGYGTLPLPQGEGA